MFCSACRKIVRRGPLPETTAHNTAVANTGERAYVGANVSRLGIMTTPKWLMAETDPAEARATTLPRRRRGLSVVAFGQVHG